MNSRVQKFILDEWGEHSFIGLENWDNLLRTFSNIDESSHCSAEGLDDREEYKDTDIISEHPKHEHSHQYLCFGSSCDLPEFLNGKGDTLSTISRFLGSSTEETVKSLVNPKGVASCCYILWTVRLWWSGWRETSQRGIGVEYYYNFREKARK